MVDLAEIRSVKSARKPKGEGHVRRAEILRAAERIFVEYGYEGATIRRIAEDVGVSSTALYMHFRDKDEILVQICETAFEKLQQASQATAALSITPEDKVRTHLQDYVRFGFENPNTYRLIYLTRPPEADHGAQQAAQSLGAQLFETFSRSVRELAEAGRLTCDPKVAAQVLWAGVHGIVALQITKPYFDWADRNALTDTMIGALMRGLIRA